MNLDELGRKARRAANLLATADTTKKNRFLLEASQMILEATADIVQANETDLEYGRSKDLSSAMMDRLALNAERIRSMSGSLEAVSKLPDPVGVMEDLRSRPNGLQVGRQRIPLGVLGIIYESRPNVTSEAASLCVKAGNAVILKGGSEAFHSNQAIAKVLRSALNAADLPEDAVQVIPSTERSVVLKLIQMSQWLDLVIPRGGEGLIRFVTENARVPVIQHFKGNCHVYVHQEADLQKAVDIVVNAKTQRPGVCNAAESLLVDRAIADRFLPRVGDALLSRGVEIRGCPTTHRIIPQSTPATDADWDEEYLDLKLAVRVVDDLEQALDHIQDHTTHHTEAIVTENRAAADTFTTRIQSSCVVVNASTRFNDGFELGLGAEIGISTSKLHAYGPMGLQELTARRFVVLGAGQIRT
jgi:glutamate-5-semialdehyde dehydrogenase